MALDYILFYFQFKVTATQVLTRLKSDAEIGFSRRFFFIIETNTNLYSITVYVSTFVTRSKGGTG